MRPELGMDESGWTARAGQVGLDKSRMTRRSFRGRQTLLPGERKDYDSKLMIKKIIVFEILNYWELCGSSAVDRVHLSPISTLGPDHQPLARRLPRGESWI